MKRHTLLPKLSILIFLLWLQPLSAIQSDYYLRLEVVPGIVWKAITNWQTSMKVSVPDETRQGIMSRFRDMADQLVQDAANKGLNDTEFDTHVTFATLMYLDFTYLLQSCGTYSLTESTKCDWANTLDPNSLHESTFWDWVIKIFRSYPQLGYLTLKTSPDKGEITINGKFEGYTERRWALSPGSHTYKLVVPDNQRTTCSGKIEIESKREYTLSCPNGN